jgi:glutamate-ammonia-ligase adenylyltransferase
MASLDHLLAAAPDPAAAGARLEQLREDAVSRRELDSLAPESLRTVVNLISVSRFLFHFICRQPAAMAVIGTGTPVVLPAHRPVNSELLLETKYLELLRIAAADLLARQPYEQVLQDLSNLAERTLRSVLELAAAGDKARTLLDAVCVFALGKLGAAELNFSSDLDLIYVSANGEDRDIEVFQKQLMDGLLRFSRLLEERNENGFLYRVDLNLRPWGRSGPLFMALDDTEHYYEASSDGWERIAWLRARPVAGAMSLGNELLQRLQPFLYRRSLSSQDLERFISIKNDMASARRRRGQWNVKVGEGGIRDIEFFVQILQLVNAARHPRLKSTSTLQTLSWLAEYGLVPVEEARDMRAAYLFLRRLENRLQMIDEQQTHELPEDPVCRLMLARSLGLPGKSDDEMLEMFETELLVNRAVARRAFEHILPAAGSGE